MENYLPALSQFFTFHHGQCDAILRQREISIWGAYSPLKGNTIYLGLAFVAIWELLVVGTGVHAWISKDAGASTKVWRFVSLFFGANGLVGLAAQLIGAARYSTTCRLLLHGGQAPQTTGDLSRLEGALFIIATGLIWTIGSFVGFLHARILVAADAEDGLGRSSSSYEVTRVVFLIVSLVGVALLATGFYSLFASPLF